MFTVYPSFYNAFRCKASQCRHSCCRGWEIDIDDDTARRYLSAAPPLGDRLRAAIAVDDEGYRFRLTPDARCPFLTDAGLCELIMAYGEDGLCDICAMHPRFFAAAGDWEICGLGLSCEKVCELLCAAPSLRFTVAQTGETTDVAGLFAALGCAAAPRAFQFTPRIDRAYYTELLRCFSLTEPIEARWSDELATLSAALDDAISAASAYRKTYDAALFDRMFQYILYRQADAAASCGFPALRAYGRYSVDYIFLNAARYGAPAEQLRRWSEQIEYSTENVEILMREIRANSVFS